MREHEQDCDIMRHNISISPIIDRESLKFENSSSTVFSGTVGDAHEEEEPVRSAATLDLQIGMSDTALPQSEMYSADSLLCEANLYEFDSLDCMDIFKTAKFPQGNSDSVDQVSVRDNNLTEEEIEATAEVNRDFNGWLNLWEPELRRILYGVKNVFDCETSLGNHILRPMLSNETNGTNQTNQTENNGEPDGYTRELNANVQVQTVSERFGPRTIEMGEKFDDPIFGTEFSDQLLPFSIPLWRESAQKQNNSEEREDTINFLSSCQEDVSTPLRFGSGTISNSVSDGLIQNGCRANVMTELITSGISVNENPDRCEPPQEVPHFVTNYMSVPDPVVSHIVNDYRRASESEVQHVNNEFESVPPTIMDTQAMEIESATNQMESVNEVQLGETDSTEYRCESVESKSVENETETNLRVGGALPPLQSEILKCQTCDEPFSTKEELKRHRRRKHPNAKILSCDHCPMKFSLKCNKMKHIRTVHHNERNFECTEEGCKKRFAEKNKMKKHIASVHKAQKNFKCSWQGCNGMFGQKSDLTRHISIIHEEVKRFECVSCKEAESGKNQFGRRSSLAQHLSRVHAMTKEEVKECFENGEYFTKNYFKYTKVLPRKPSRKVITKTRTHKNRKRARRNSDDNE